MDENPYKSPSSIVLKLPPRAVNGPWPAYFYLLAIALGLALGVMIVGSIGCASLIWRLVSPIGPLRW